VKRVLNFNKKIFLARPPELKICVVKKMSLSWWKKGVVVCDVISCELVEKKGESDEECRGGSREKVMM
jgi:hypothetical protein